MVQENTPEEISRSLARVIADADFWYDMGKGARAV